MCLSACWADIKPAPPSQAASDSLSEAAPFEPAPGVLRRLTQAQYRTAMRQLFGNDIFIPDALEPDVEANGFLAIGSAVTSISARGVEQYEQAAFEIADQAFETPDIRGAILPCEPAGVADADCQRDFVTAIGRQAWRRPLEEVEIEQLVDIATQAGEVLDDADEGLEYALAAILQSPNFLFRPELGEENPADENTLRLSDHEVASRLAFFFWNAPPDEELLAAADAGELTDDAGLLAQVERMRRSGRAREGVRSYFTEMLTLYLLDGMVKDPTIFEHMSPDVGPSAREETLLTLDYLIFEEGGDYRDIMTTSRTFLNRKLASIYNVSAPSRDGFGETVLPPESGRRGLLGQLSTLALHSHSTGTSPTLRGMFVREVLLCQPIPAPPAGVDASIPEPSGDAPTLRDRVAEHLINPGCSSCHNLTDWIGLGLENFDGLGRYRRRENDTLIDASGALEGKHFSDAWELAGVLRENEALTTCLVQSMYRYATGHVETEGEQGLLRELHEQFAESGYQVRRLMVDIAMSPGFRLASETE